MCQKIATIIWDGVERSTCPTHVTQKLRAITGCPECGWKFAGSAGILAVVFKKRKKKGLQLVTQ